MVYQQHHGVGSTAGKEGFTVGGTGGLVTLECCDSTYWLNITC